MARDHARVQVAIWNDPDFRSLPIEPQHMYFTLISQVRLNYCGVLDYLPGRLERLSTGSTIATVDQAVDALERERFVVVDRDTQELLIRTFVRHDGLLASPNMTKAMVRDYQTVISDSLRKAVDDELRKAFRDGPELAGWKGLQQASATLHERVTGTTSENPSGNPSRKGSPSHV